MCAVAIAQPTGSVDLSTSVSGLPSASGVYGPVTEQRLSVRLPPNAALGFELINRNSGDTFGPRHTVGANVDYYRRWSPHLSSYALVSTSSGPPYAARSAYLQGSVSNAHGLAASAGAGLSSLYGFGAYRVVKLGGTYYRGDGYAALTYTAGWSPAFGNTQAYLGSVAFGHPGRTTETFYLGTGSETDVSLVNAGNPTLAGERERGASVLVRHWVNPNAGYRVAVETGSLNRANGSQIYRRRGISVGAFMKFGP